MRGYFARNWLGLTAMFGVLLCLPVVYLLTGSMDIAHRSAVLCGLITIILELFREKGP